MKSKYWILMLAAALLICVALSVWLLWPKAPAAKAEIWSDGALVETLELSSDREVTVQSKNGTNVVTVKDGKIAVTEATCPDHYCMQRGYCHSGAQIVCLPNRLVIKFTGTQSIDGVSG